MDINKIVLGATLLAIVIPATIYNYTNGYGSPTWLGYVVILFAVMSIIAGFIK